MSMAERHGTRDLTYSAWHRRLSWPGSATPGIYDMIDLDSIEYCHFCRLPLMFVEEARRVRDNQPKWTWTPSQV